MVTARPGLSRVFESLGIDYCCGGKRPLGVVCAERKLDVGEVLAQLAAAESRDEADGFDLAGVSLAALADHIERTHHAYLRAELPRLVEMAERVARKHGWRDGRLPEVGERVFGLAREMSLHMTKEENILFPYIRELEATGTRPAAGCGSVANPIRQMEAEHDSAGNTLARLRELTDGFTPDENSCNTHRALLAGLAELEADLHRHVHKENNILFPRALALEAAS